MAVAKPESGPREVVEEYPDIKVRITVNGVEREVMVKPYERLIDVLRYKLGLLSVKEGCGRGECGTCVVIMDGHLVPSCMVLAIRANGREVVTLEGLAPEGMIHAVQKAFLDTLGVQCGFCFPGVILATKWLLDRNPDPSDEEIKDALGGQLCRCGSYLRFVEAVKLAAKYIKEGRTYFDVEDVKKELYLRG
ncbi:MAG: (2Fe-2S)-binding protein [Desulfurococcales archaeon ex4484_204]|nr:MAG: (2Fe-2S)-binding protein [Desulfurococcales archaeon ex4484_204]